MFQHDRQRTGRSPYAGPQGFDTAWTYPALGPWNVGCPVVGEDGTVYFEAYGDSLCAIAPDGVLKWKCHKVSNNVTPALDSTGRIYIIGANASLLCLEDSITFARLVWMSDSAVRPNATGHPLVSSTGDIYDGQVTSFNGDGSLRWHNLLANSGVPAQAWRLTQQRTSSTRKVGYLLFVRHLGNGHKWSVTVVCYSWRATSIWPTRRGQ